MAKTQLNLGTPIRVITSGTAPTTSTLKKGEWAYGVINGVKRLFGNPTGSAVVEFSELAAIKQVAYNGTTATLTFTSVNGATTDIVLPKENFLSSATYNPASKKIIFTLADDSTVEVSVSDLIDVYTAGADGGLEVAGNAFKIKAGGVVETMLAAAIVTKLNKVLGITGGAAEAGKYISAIAVNDHAITVTKASLPVTPTNYPLMAADSQPISVGGTTQAVTVVLNESVAVSGGGIKVTGGALELDADNIEVSWVVTEI
jgi:hypothetical protein